MPPVTSNTPLDEAAVQGIELESWSKMIPDLMYDGKTLYSRMKKGTKSYPVANVTAAPGNIGATTGIAQRPAFRVPVRVQSGATIVQGTGDGDSLGRGSGSQWVSGDISPIFLFAGYPNVPSLKFGISGKLSSLVN